MSELPQLFIQGASKNDQLFSKPALDATYNITNVKTWLEKNKVQPRVMSVTRHELKMMLKEITIDPRHVEIVQQQMAEKGIIEPTIHSILPGGECLLIDGHHRLKAMSSDTRFRAQHLLHFPSLHIPYPALSLFKVNVFMTNANGEKKRVTAQQLIDLSNGNMVTCT